MRVIKKKRIPVDREGKEALYRGTSLIRNCPPLGSYSKEGEKEGQDIPRHGSLGGGKRERLRIYPDTEVSIEEGDNTMRTHPDRDVS